MEACRKACIPPQKSLLPEKLSPGWTLPGYDPPRADVPAAAGVASGIVEALGRGVEIKLYELRALAVMANHVHVLFRPRQEVSQVLQWAKGTPARQANRILARIGKPFWQRESYDHWIRDNQQFERIVVYIESNPVKAGLVTEASEYQWPTAWKRVAHA